MKPSGMAKIPTVVIAASAMCMLSCVLCVDAVGQAVVGQEVVGQAELGQAEVGQRMELPSNRGDTRSSVSAWVVFGSDAVPPRAFGATVPVAMPGTAKWIDRFQAKVGPSCSVLIEGDRKAARPSVATVLDADRRVLAVRPIGPDLLVVVRDTLSGRLDLGLARELAAITRQLSGDESGRDDPSLLARTREVQRLIPEQELPWQLELSQLMPLDGVARRVERDFLHRLTSTLCSRPESLASVLLRAFIADPSIVRHPSTASAIDRLLARPRRESPSIARLGFELAVALEDVDASLRWAFALMEYHRHDADAMHRLARQIAELRPALEFEEPLRTCFEFALRVRPTDEALLRDYFAVLTTRHERGVDWIAAERIGYRLLGAIGQDERALNSLAWRLLTEDPWQGRLEGLALDAARRMQDCPGWETHWRIDTVALAEFANGHLEAAVELQEQAVAGCEAGIRPRYLRRLTRYRTALAVARSAAEFGAGAAIRVRNSRSR